MSPPQPILCNWLGQHEAGRGADSFGIQGVYLEYHAARLMRLYLRAALNSCRSAVIAGGYPAAMYAEINHYRTWRPHDIDIFFFNEEDLEEAEVLYDTMVARPLGRHYAVEDWEPGNSFSLRCKAEYESNVDNTQEQLAHVLRAKTLRERVERWQDSNDVSINEVMCNGI